MRLYSLLFFIFIACSAEAQTTHSFGVGTFVNTPFVKGNHPSANDSKLLVRFSPFANYTLEMNWLNFSIGAGNWNNTFEYVVDFDSTVNNPGGVKGTVIYDYNYAFMPISVGANVVTTERWEAVVEVIGMLKYLHLLNFDVDSSDPIIEKAIRQYTSVELDNLGLQRFGTSIGGGLYVAYNGGRFIPKLQLGYIVDLNEVYKSSTENYKFRNPYAAFTINYILRHRAKMEKHDGWIKW